MAKELGCSNYTVNDYIQQNKLRAEYKLQQRKKEADIILSMLRNGTTIKKIAQELGSSANRISRLIQQFDLFNLIV